ncbi:MAG: PadR family transcriptional regulator [Acidobacteria bacterium]|nr:PadR family transcriptional regulator [Acidobacteriota bacterium]
MKTNRSRYAILGLLSHKPSTGYDIRKTIEQELSHFWNESYGQIYPILNALAAEKLATCRRRRQSGKPDRQVYSITARGRRALREWLRQPAALQTERNETLLKLLFSESLSPSERRGLIESYRQKQQELLAQLNEIEKTLDDQYRDRDHSGFDTRLLTVSHGRAEARARIRWCDQVLRELGAPS